MKITHQEQSYYLYLTVAHNEDWITCAKKIVAKMKKKGWRYDKSEAGDFTKEIGGDFYSNGAVGAPLYFVKKKNI